VPYVYRERRNEMRDKWKIKRVMGYTGYYRVLNSAGGGVKGSVWYEPSFRRYKWMASSRMGLQTGWSRTPTGAKRGWSRAMWLMKRWLDAQGE
jgi:hypothetical protein